jgi:hypothetical protein
VSGLRGGLQRITPNVRATLAEIERFAAVPAIRHRAQKFAGRLRHCLNV